MAELVVRARRIRLRPAPHHVDKDPIAIWVVHALEENPPENTRAVEWFLLTTIDILCAADAEHR